MRYIAKRINPDTGSFVVRSRPSRYRDVLIREYANDRNALRYMHRHLAAPEFTPGQYQVRRWPVGEMIDEGVVGILYKKVVVNAQPAS